MQRANKFNLAEQFFKTLLSQEKQTPSFGQLIIEKGKVMSLIEKIFEVNTQKKDSAELTECNYADNYYGDQVCLTRQVDLPNIDL